MKSSGFNAGAFFLFYSSTLSDTELLDTLYGIILIRILYITDYKMFAR